MQNLKYKSDTFSYNRENIKVSKNTSQGFSQDKVTEPMKSKQPRAILKLKGYPSTEKFINSIATIFLTAVFFVGIVTGINCVIEFLMPVALALCDIFRTHTGNIILFALIGLCICVLRDNLRTK